MPSIASFISYILFADDTSGIYSSPSLEDLFNTVENELDTLNAWFSCNRLLINVSKTNFVLFTTRQREQHFNLHPFLHQLKLSSTPISKKDTVKFLGLQIDKNVTFKNHIECTCKKILNGIYALSRAAKAISGTDLKTLYSALILPYLNYGLLAWGGFCMLNTKYIILDHGGTQNDLGYLTSIHNLQKRALRIISKVNRHAHHVPLCYNLNLLDLKELYIIKALSFFHDYYHNLLPPAFSNIFTLFYSRNNELLIRKTYRRTKTAATSIIHTLPDIWNSLNELYSNTTRTLRIVPISCSIVDLRL